MNDPQNPQGYAAPFVGTDRFEVIDQLGAGAMCVVYRARDRKHGDIVALKTLRHLDSNSLYRLKQEFRALSHFDHPNLVSFSELVYSEQGWFVTMELVEGVDYLTFTRGEEAGRESRTEGSTWSTQTAGVIVGDETAEDRAPDKGKGLPDLIRLRSSMRQLAEGIHTLHSAGRVHRDLKPSNVLVTSAGRVVILDFGLVAEIDQDYTEGTLHQNIAGSAAYMSPEQSVGRPLGEASDWYSVGVMLYEALTGVWPFQGHLYQILTKKQEEDPPAPNTLVDGVPQDLNDLAMALLAREPEARPSGAEVVAFFREGGSETATHQRVLQPRFRFRESQLDVLQRGYAHARSGRACTVLVRGAAGTGKTKLIREFVKDLKRQDEVVVLKGQCFEWESLPYKALDGLMDNLSRVLRRLDHRSVIKLANPGLPYLAEMFPVLNRVDAFGITQPADLDRLDEASLRQRGFEGLFQLLGDLARAVPVLLLLDDAQWGDELSAAVLGEIVKFSAGVPLLVVLAVRTDAQGPFVGRFLQPVQGAKVPVEVLDLGPLSFEQSTVIAGEMLELPVGDERVRRIALESKGVPQYIKELVHQLAFEAGRESAVDHELNEVTVSEIGALPGASQRLLSLLALCDEPLPDDVALSASGLAGQAFEAISTLRALHLINVQGMQGQDTLQIASEAVREYVIDRIPEDWRTSFHGRVAAAMEDRGTYPAESVIKHYAGANEYKKAGLVAWLAASEKLKSGKAQEAVWLLGRARDYGEWTGRERQRILTHLAEALANTGAGKQAADAYQEAAKDAVGSRARALRHLAAEELLTSGHLAEGTLLMDALLKESGVAIRQGGGWFGSGLLRRKPQWKNLDFSSDSKAKFEDDDLERVDLAWSAAMGRRLISASEGAAAQATHLELALKVGEPERALRALGAEVRFRGEAGEADWRERYERVTSQAQARSSKVTLARATAAASAAAYSDGAWVDAATYAASAENMFQHNRVGSAWERFQCRTIGSMAQLQRGDFRAAAERALPLVRELEQVDSLLFHAVLHAAVIGWLRMAEDDASAGLAQLAQTPQELVSSAGIPFFHLLETWTNLQLYNGRSESAWKYLEQRWTAAERGMDAAPRYLAAQVWATRARAALATVDSAGPGNLKVARNAIASARKIGLTWMTPWLMLLEAALAQAEGGKPMDLLAVAGWFQQGDQSMGSAVALLYTPSHDQARAWMVDQGVKEPEKFAQVFAPGLRLPV